MKRRGRLVCLLVWGGYVVWGQSAWAQDMRAGVERLAGQIIKAAPEGRQLRLAVADFPDLQGAVSDFGRYIANRLSTRLGQTPKFVVFERQRLAQVLSELKFSLSDLVDPVKAKQLGKMTGVDYIMVGTVSDMGNSVEVDARIIELEVNQVLLGETVTISKDQAVMDMLERGRTEPSSSSAPRSSSPLRSGTSSPQGGSSQAKSRAAGGLKLPERVDRKDFSFTLEACDLSGASLVCRIFLVNHDSVPRPIQFYLRESYVLDSTGQQYIAERFKSISGEKSGRRVWVEVPADIPQPVDITFAVTENVVPASIATKWYRNWGPREREFYVVFK